MAMMLVSSKRPFLGILIFFLNFSLQGIALSQCLETVFPIPQTGRLQENDDCSFDDIQENLGSIVLFSKDDFNNFQKFTHTDQFFTLQESIFSDRGQNFGDKDKADFLFQCYIYGLLTTNLGLILSVTGDNLSFPFYSYPINKEQQHEFFYELFATFEFNKVGIESLYCLNSKKIIKVNEDRIFLSLFTREKIPVALQHWHYWEDFWGLEHYYFFENFNGEWKLIAFDIDYKKGLL